MKVFNTRTLGALLATATVLCPVAAQAQYKDIPAQRSNTERVWDALGDGFNWTGPYNWVSLPPPGAVGPPQAFDIATFDDLGGSVSIFAPTQVAELRVRNSALILNLNNNNLTIFDRLLVGRGLAGQIGQLTILNGSIQIPNTLSMNDVRFGSSSLTTGRVTLSPGTSIDTGGEFIVGDKGIGEMTLTGGATASAGVFLMLGNGIGSDGTISVSGLGSAVTTPDTFVVGNSGNGHLSLLSQATASARRMVIGDEIESLSSDVLVSGTGSRITLLEDNVVGNFGVGSLTISNNATMTANIAHVGKAPGSIGTLSLAGPGASYTITTDIFLGREGVSTVSLTNGATLSSLNSFAGHLLGSSGTVTVNNATWNAGTLALGNFGNGTLTASNGAIITSTRAKIGDEGPISVGNATLTGLGTTWTDNDVLFVGNRGTGTLSIQNGAHVNAFSMIIGAGFGGSGHLIASGVGSQLNLTSGLTSGSFSPATIDIADGSSITAASYTQSATSTLNVNITAAGSGLISTTGSATLAGTLNVVFDPAFIPTASMTFDIINAGSVFGTFAFTTLPPNVIVTYAPTRVFLTLTLPATYCPVDLNDDGIVDVLDFFAFISAFNSGDMIVDFNSDGIVDVLDFFSFIFMFNNGCP